MNATDPAYLDYVQNSEANSKNLLFSMNATDPTYFDYVQNSEANSKFFYNKMHVKFTKHFGYAGVARNAQGVGFMLMHVMNI